MPGDYKGFNNDGVKSECIELTIPLASDITIYAHNDDDGNTTETATVKCLQKGSLGKGFALIAVNAGIAIVTLGSKTFRNPKTVASGTTCVLKQTDDFHKIVIRTFTDNTTFELFML